MSISSAGPRTRGDGDSANGPFDRGRGALELLPGRGAGFAQGVTELFPISSLGHTVLFPTLFGWHALVRSQSDPESFWLAFVVMLHVGSALGLLIYFWRDWVGIIGGFFSSLTKRKVETQNEKLAWLIIAASIPTGILGLLLEHPVRIALAKPTAAAIFLMVNGVMLIAAERLRRRGDPRWRAAQRRPDPREGREMTSLTYQEAGVIGLAQSTALIAGISRDGVCMTTGLLRGLNNEGAARFAFLLADADHPRGGHLQALGPDRPTRRGDPGTGGRRSGLRCLGGDRRRALAVALLPQ
jgi:undecaprenyl-diphosphatase